MSFVRDYIAYLKDNPEGYWFKRKLYGWGWDPATWHGWLVMVVFLVLIAWNAVRIDSMSHSVSDTLLNFVPQTIALVLVLIAICFVTGESPKWQWGLPKKSNEEK